MVEYGAFLRDRENLDRQIAKTTDPVERQRLDLRKQIEAAEYMALTSERIAGQSEIIVGKMNSPEAMKERVRAKGFQEQAQALRKEYRELGVEREQGNEQGEAISREEPPLAQASPKPEHSAALKVEERTAGKPRGPEQNLSDFVKSIPEKQPRREFTKEELRNDPAAKQAAFIQLKDDKNRAVALESIGRDMKNGKNLNTNDIRRLSREDLDGIKLNGDSHLKAVVQQHEQEREKRRGLER